MKFSVRVNKYYESRKIYEELEEDNPAVYLLFGLCNYIAGNDTVNQGRQMLEDLKKGIIHELPNYKVDEVTKIENYTRTGKLEYDLTKMAKDGMEIGELLSVLFKDVWHKTTKDLIGDINDNTKALIDIVSEINTAMPEVTPEVFEDNFPKLMEQHDWSEVESEYQKDKKMHTVSMRWLQEKQERKLQEVLEMDVMYHADDPSTDSVEKSDYPYHRRFLSHKFEDNPSYQEAYTKFMEFATRQEEMIIPKLGEYGKYIATHIDKFRLEQKKELLAIIKRFELIHKDMVRLKPELGKYLYSSNSLVSLENTKLFAPYFHIKEMLKSEWFRNLRVDTKYNDMWADAFAEALMRSEYGCQIADEWKEKDYKIKGYVIGCLKEAGVFNANVSNDSLAKDAAIIRNTRTFGKYIGADSQKQPYAEWVREHADDYCK